MVRKNEYFEKLGLGRSLLVALVAVFSLVLALGSVAVAKPPETEKQAREARKGRGELNATTASIRAILDQPKRSRDNSALRSLDRVIVKQLISELESNTNGNWSKAWSHINRRHGTNGEAISRFNCSSYRVKRLSLDALKKYAKGDKEWKQRVGKKGADRYRILRNAEPGRRPRSDAFSKWEYQDQTDQHALLITTSSREPIGQLNGSRKHLYHLMVVLTLDENEGGLRLSTVYPIDSPTLNLQSGVINHTKRYTKQQPSSSTPNDATRKHDTPPTNATKRSPSQISQNTPTHYAENSSPFAITTSAASTRITIPAPTQNSISGDDVLLPQPQPEQWLWGSLWMEKGSSGWRILVRGST